MIHELCHTRYLNHSRRYWQLVERHCPDYRRHEKHLGQPDSLVPDWFVPGPVTKYHAWDKPGYKGSVFIDKANGHIHFYGVQL